MSLFTVFGATGFIGRHLTAYLRSEGHDVVTPPRGHVMTAGGNLGHVIYAIGMTGDYRQRPHDTLEAHVGIASHLLRLGNFHSFLYLSSTRVYRGLSQDQLAQEDTPLPLTPSLDATYDYSKLLGESLCLAHDNPAVRVARLSNIYGEGMSEALFLGAVIADLKREGRATIQDHALSAKDYLSIHDATSALVHIASQGQQRLYNVASGIRTTNRELADAMTTNGKQVEFAATSAAPRIFPRIDTTRLQAEFALPTHTVTQDISTLLL